MPQLTDAQLTTEANVIGDETTPGANTADRVRDMLIDMIDSKVNNDEATGILTTTITNGDTTHAPDGNAVFDALALKADISQNIGSLLYLYQTFK